MKHSSSRSKPSVILLMPAIGCIIFMVLYLIATTYYPGGSEFDKSAKGFNWSKNYWCNLIPSVAINGQLNPARPIALTAMVVLCLSVSLFFFQFAGLAKSKAFCLLIRFSGILSMIIAALIFLGDHDLMINIAGAFGLIALTGVYILLYRLKWHRLFAFAMFNLVLIFLNNVIYHGQWHFETLAVVQKITFLSFLIWVVCVNISQSKLR